MRKNEDYENFEKGMIYMKILEKRGIVEKRGEEETKSMPHAPVIYCTEILFANQYVRKWNVTCIASGQ